MNRRAVAVLLACFGTVFTAYAIRYSYGTLLPGMLTTLAIGKAQAGVIYAAYFVAYTLLSPVMGILSDRYDMRLLISISVAVMGVGTFLMQYATTVWQASLFFTIAGLGCAACWAPVMAVAQRWASRGRRGLILAMVDAGSTLGVIAAGSVAPLIAAGSYWPRGWLYLGILGVLLGVVDFILIRSYPPSGVPAALKQDRGNSPTGNIDYKRFFSDRRFWLIGLAYLMTGFAVMVPFTFISTFALQERSFSYTGAGLLVTVIGAAGLIGKLTLGPWSDRLGRLIIMLGCALLITAGCLGMAFGRGWVIYLMAALFGAGYGACWSLYAACAADFFSIKAAGGIIGIWTFYLGIGLLSSPILAGWIGDRSGSLKGAFILAAAAGLISLALLWPLRPGAKSKTGA
jgi:MFS family permease